MSGLIEAYAHRLWSESGLPQRLRAGIRIAAALVLLLVLLAGMIAVGLCALAVALFMALQGTMSPAVAAAGTAAAFLVVAAVVTAVLWSRSRRHSPAPPAPAANAEMAVAVDEVRALLDAGMSRTTGTIRRQPLTSMLTAVAMGIAVAHLVDRPPAHR